jgi:predicted oxidoreductase
MKLEAVENKKSEKWTDFGLSNFTNSQTELIRQKQKVANQVQFSATIFWTYGWRKFDYMQLNKIRNVLESLGFVFRIFKPSFTTILAGF